MTDTLSPNSESLYVMSVLHEPIGDLVFATECKGIRSAIMTAMLYRRRVHWHHVVLRKLPDGRLERVFTTKPAKVN